MGPININTDGIFSMAVFGAVVAGLLAVIAVVFTGILIAVGFHTLFLT